MNPDEEGIVLSEEHRKTLITMLDRTPSRVAALVAGQPDEALVRKPSSEVFSMRETVHHLRDIEVEGYATRLARILEADHPLLPDIEGDRLARERRYNERPHEEVLVDFERARQGCVTRLSSLDPEAWSRQGDLEGVGKVTVERLVEMWCAHDAGHIGDLERLRTFLGLASVD